MFFHGSEDVVAGRPASIGVPEGKIRPLPISLIPHLTEKKAGIIDTAESLSGPMQGVGLPPLHFEVQEPKGIYLVQDKVETCHGENHRSHLDILLLILPVFSFFTSFVFWQIRVIVQFGQRVLILALTVEVESYSPPAPPPSARSLAATHSSSFYDPPPFLLWYPSSPERARAQVLRRQL